MKNIAIFSSVLGIFLLTGATVYFNIQEQRAVDRSKIPEKGEAGKGFQKWITNLKNKDFVIEADEFRLVEENDLEILKYTYEKHKDIKGVVFSPSGEEFVDYRNIERYGYQTYEVRLYGLKEDKIIDARILDCSPKANCYFDRAYFLDNDVFVISEI